MSRNELHFNLKEMENIDSVTENVRIVRFRKHDIKNPVCLSKPNCCGNAYEHGHFSLSRFTLYPPCGNVSEMLNFDFPLLFRNAKTPFFTLCYCLAAISVCFAEGMASQSDRLRIDGYLRALFSGISGLQQTEVFHQLAVH